MADAADFAAGHPAPPRPTPPHPAPPYLTPPQPSPPHPTPPRPDSGLPSPGFIQNAAIERRLRRVEATLELIVGDDQYAVKIQDAIDGDKGNDKYKDGLQVQQMVAEEVASCMAVYNIREANEGTAVGDKLAMLSSELALVNTAMKDKDHAMMDTIGKMQEQAQQLQQQQGKQSVELDTMQSKYVAMQQRIQQVEVHLNDLQEATAMEQEAQEGRITAMKNQLGAKQVDIEAFHGKLEALATQVEEVVQLNCNIRVAMEVLATQRQLQAMQERHDETHEHFKIAILEASQEVMKLRGHLQESLKEQIQSEIKTALAAVGQKFRVQHEELQALKQRQDRYEHVTEDVSEENEGAQRSRKGSPGEAKGKDRGNKSRWPKKK